MQVSQAGASASPFNSRIQLFRETRDIFIFSQVM